MQQNLKLKSNRGTILNLPLSLKHCSSSSLPVATMHPNCSQGWATWLLFTGAPAWSVALRVRCPAPLGSCSPACPLGVLCCVCGVLGHLAPVHRCARSVRCFACAMFWAAWLLFTGVPAWFVVLRLRCPEPLGSCSRVRPLRALLCWCGVLGHLAPVHRCAHSVCCVVCAVSWATWLLFIAVRCVACAMSWATWLLFTGVPARCVVLRVRCPAHLAPVHRCARSVRCCAGAVSWATWLLFTGVLAPCAVWCVRCPAPLGSCSPVCPSVLCFARAASWATWLLFTGVPALCVVSRIRCPGPLGSCSRVCPLSVLCCVYGVLGPLALVHRCARSVCCGVCDVMGLLGPVHRCARSVCCAVGCVCGASLRGAHSSIRTAAIRSRQGLGTLRARTRLSGRRLFRSRQGLGLLPGAHTSVRTAAGVAWHLFSCRGSFFGAWGLPPGEHNTKAA